MSHGAVSDAQMGEYKAAYDRAIARDNRMTLQETAASHAGTLSAQLDKWQADRVKDSSSFDEYDMHRRGSKLARQEIGDHMRNAMRVAGISHPGTEGMGRKHDAAMEESGLPPKQYWARVRAEKAGRPLFG